ncbi:MAG: HipA N-terminal domain-containing protein [Candidatus Omnitrophica bacterium]|nr:HipA N-terminal domain-containing protein [Candidatus Omnitrophota bacterium]
MQKADVFIEDRLVGSLIKNDKQYVFEYIADYDGKPISLTMPISQKRYEFDEFPSFFDGLLPEGIQLESLLKNNKVDRQDYLAQLIEVGEDLVGNVTVRGVQSE